jgi:hypothetical protein
MSTRDPGPRPAHPEAVPRADEADARPAARERLAVGLRAAVALLVLAALVWSTVQAVRDGVLAQHVSYFTNQSNLLFALLLVASVALPRRRRPDWWDDVRGAAAFYLVMTGIIYALLVAPLDELLRWDIGWTGIVLHRIAPIAALLDWLLTPRRRRPSAWRLLGWLAYPIAYLVLTWLRGGVTGWYPYAFLDPTVSSWPQVLMTTGVVLVAFLVIAAAVHLVQGRLLQGRLHRKEVPGRDPGPDLR